ncbi:hypothetical protein C8J57DRAFT_1608522 [Mycena rebaudengoi]|nr:hypothetical protein C8J57DRAFT_1608522 [Mycena rebaudengoi]
MFGVRSFQASFLLLRTRSSPLQSSLANDMEPDLQVEFADILTLSPAEQRAGLQRVQEKISIGKSDIALLEKQQREEIAQLEERHRGERALLDAKQRELEEKQREWEAALDRVVFPVLTIPPEIVSLIFIASLPTNLHPEPSPNTAPLLVAQICRRWREIALETSELWASVYIPAARRNGSELLEAWLQRAKGVPVSLYLDPQSALVHSPISFLTTYSAQVRSLSITLSLTDVQDLLVLRPSFPVFRGLAMNINEKLGDDVVFFEDFPALLELRASGSVYTISTSTLGTYPTLTKLHIDQQISATDFHRVLRACPHLLELEVLEVSADNSQPDVTSHPTLEVFDCCDQSRPPICILDSLSVPNLRKLTIQTGMGLKSLIHFLERSSCSLRYLELANGFGSTHEEWQQCLNHLPCLESLVFDSRPCIFFEAAASSLFLPLLRDLEVTFDGDDIDYGSAANFLSSRRDTMGIFHSLEINLNSYFNPRPEATTNLAGVAALVKHGAKISVDDTGFALQWKYLAQPVE